MGVSLLFDGDIELNSDISEEDGYRFELLSTSRRGSPVPVEVTLASFIRDGSIVEWERDENREMTLQIRVTAPDSQALSLGVARLDRATKKRTTLIWESMDGIAPSTLFDVQTSNLIEPDWNDLAEVRNQRTFGLRLVCLPQAFSVDEIIDDAGTPPSSGGTLLDACESTTGWARAASMTYPAVYAVDAAIYSEGAGSLKSRVQRFTNDFSAGTARSTAWDARSGLSYSTGSGGYLGARLRVQYSLLSVRIWVTTVEEGRVEVATPLATSLDSAGFVHYVWLVGAGLTVTGYEVYSVQVGPIITSINTNPHYVWHDALELLPAATTDHQIVKQLEVQGSARTPGSLHVSSPVDSLALGKVLAITAATEDLAAGFTPDGRRWVVQGDTTVDATALWGSYYTPDPADYSDDVGTPDRPIFDVPVSMLTAGPYSIVALVKAESSPTLVGVQAQLRYGTTDVGPVSAAEISAPNLAAGQQFVTVGTVDLPPLPMQSADGDAKVRFLFKGAKLIDFYMIPVWRKGGRPIADYSITDCGSGTAAAGGPSSHLWLDSPTPSQRLGGTWRGASADRVNVQSARRDASVRSDHTFRAGGLTAFLVSTDAAGPQLDLRYRPAWFGSAGL